MDGSETGRLSEDAFLGTYRELQRRLESDVPSAATSIDGRRFQFTVPVHDLTMRLGGYVVIGHDGHGRVGQVLALDMHHIEGTTVDLAVDGGRSLRNRLQLRVAQGEGVLLDGDGSPFADEPVRPATPAEVGSWLAAAAPLRAALPIGELRFAPGETFSLDAAGFNRHTFLCGQSGSGKTYALGVVLEHLLLETNLQLVILDPNSDFVRLAEPRDDVAPGLAGRYREAVGSVLHHGADGDGPGLHVRPAELGADALAALLRLDPIADRMEYAELAELLATAPPGTIERLLETDRRADGLVARIRNLGLDRLGVWARGDTPSTLDELDREDVRCLSIDLGSLPTADEQAVVARGVLGALWARRHHRRPVLIVIDEAHNVCPANPESQLMAQVTDLVVRIAAEGRKYGLYLLIATQRPQKVHENIVTQCDNLVLMRLNSAADTAHACQTFSFAPAGLVDSATTFRLGEALVAGRIASHPALVRFGARISEEGGADVPATWARPLDGS